MLTHCKAIIFDMDGTLVDTLPFMIKALQETFRRYGGKQFTFDEIIAMFGPTEAGMINPRVPEAVADQAVQFFYDRYDVLHPAVPEPFPGIIDLLKELRAGGIKTGVVTGKGARTADISLKAYGLEPYIDELISGSMYGGEKPHAIRKMLAGWGLAPGEAAYVGDMTSDMEAAREAGVTAIGAGWAGISLINTDAEAGGIVFQSVMDLKKWLNAA